MLIRERGSLIKVPRIEPPKQTPTGGRRREHVLGSCRADEPISEGLLVEAHEADLFVANEAIQARVKAILAAGAETYEGELHFPDLSAKLPPAD
ncbi:hypothetical protein [Burkholderia cepacia]|uniref:hypothetical protein n=1 Tax=Burkholderia cepacia TaxID=292 RepID=UPI001CF1452A|nr:hypothetical protein [Burkholderia cepacia]MCA8080418.1 hypothetical protein [Burkholderia cepacia]